MTNSIIFIGSGRNFLPHFCSLPKVQIHEIKPMSKDLPQPVHSQAWIAQAWASLILSLIATTVGILYLPVNGWIKGYLGMGLAFTVGSTVSISKTTRDQYESKRLTARVDEARVEKLLAEHNPMN
jgi:hypothetical protein